MPTYIDLMPCEIQEKIYRNVFQHCMNELTRNYKTWKWSFDAKFTCCNTITYNDFTDRCLKSIYPNIFPFDCQCCHKPMCHNCWVTSRRTARANRTFGYQGWCVLCIWNNIYP
jgi:hypothetical protein